MPAATRRLFLLVLLLSLFASRSARAADPEPLPLILPDELPPRLGARGVPYLHVETAASHLELRVFDGIVPDYQSLRRRGGRVVSRRVCAAPCDVLVDAREGARYFFSGSGLTPSDYFRLSDRTGPLAVRVDMGSRRALNNGILVTALGAFFAFIGGGLLGIGAMFAHSGLADPAPPRIVGASFLGAAAVGWIVGPILVSRGLTSYRFSSSAPP